MFLIKHELHLGEQVVHQPGKHGKVLEFYRGWGKLEKLWESGKKQVESVKLVVSLSNFIYELYFDHFLHTKWLLVLDFRCLSSHSLSVFQSSLIKKIINVNMSKQSLNDIMYAGLMSKWPIVVKPKFFLSFALNFLFTFGTTWNKSLQVCFVRPLVEHQAIVRLNPNFHAGFRRLVAHVANSFCFYF